MMPRRLRIAIGQVSHETNTFIDRPTDLHAFQGLEWNHGDGITEADVGTRTPIGGMLAAAERLGADAIPVFATTAAPGGVITADAYAAIVEELTDGLRAAGSVDAVSLSLHGAGVVDGTEDLEGDLLRRVRRLVGDEIPIMATLDLHANLTPEMVACATALIPCLRYPHVDVMESGERAIELAMAFISNDVRPVSAFRKLRLIMPPTTTDLAPGSELLGQLAGWMDEPKVLYCALLHGFPFTDTGDVGCAALVTTNGDSSLAQEIASDLADAVLTRRQRLLPRGRDAREAVAYAQEVEQRPAIIAEISDNPGGGAPGDGTRLLRAMLDARVRNCCFGCLCDPEAARQAHAAGPGAKIHLRLGANGSPDGEAPVEGDATVVCVTDGRFRALNPMERGHLVDLGACARVRLGGVDVILTSVREQTLDPAVFILHGVDVNTLDIIALKSSHHYRAGFDHLGGTIIEADTGGVTSPDLRRRTYRRIPRPIWPFDTVDEPTSVSGVALAPRI